MKLPPLAASILIALAGMAAAKDLPPPPVLDPAAQMASFRIAEPGYRIELVAAEPMVQDPVALAFDGEGRLWVAEMRGFMRDIDRSGVNEPIGRVSVLEDIDGDGRMDRSTVFLDGLVLPRAISIQPDGVLIAENEPLWFVQDTDGDGVADRKTLVDPHYASDSVEHSANGLLRAMDNWIYNAKEGHRYRRRGEQWIREDTEKRGQWGISQDDRGRLFYNYNHSQLHADFVPPNAFSRNPNHQPSTGLSVGVTRSNQVFPIRPNPAANRAYIPGSLDAEGRIQEFTSACAPLVYRGSLFPGFAGDAFVCEPVGNLIKRNVLSGEGIAVIGQGAYEGREFLASTDERFRPCALALGPDGAIYVADIYRGVIQDGPHMSPYLREHSIARQMDRPVHLGRIWRVVPENFTPPAPPRFGAMSVPELVATLAHPDGWWRDVAQTHLVERNLREALPLLRAMALEHADSRARLHALWTLEGLGDPEPARLLPSLEDESPVVRAAALRVLTSLQLNLADELPRLTARPDLEEQVALQGLITLGDLEMAEPARLESIAALLLPRVSDPLMRDAALSSLGGREVAFLDHIWPRLEPGAEFLIEALSQAVVKSRQPAAIERLLSRLAEPGWKAAAVLAGVSTHGPRLTREPVTLAKAPSAFAAHPQLRQWFAWPGHVPPPVTTAAARPLTEAEEALYARGRQVYLTTCVACHGPDGQGMKPLAPPLAGSDWVQGAEERLVRVLLHGLIGPVTVSGHLYAPPEVQPFMPPLATLNNADIAAVLTYIRREWGNAADPISERDVSRFRVQAQGRTYPWTEQELEPFAKSQPN